jgi:hypothetical protein
VASKLPTEIDDKAIIEALRQRGYVVTGGVGAYHTEPIPTVAAAPKPNTYPPAVGHDLGTDYTSTGTANLAKTGPLGTGGASTGDGGAFPKP